MSWLRCIAVLLLAWGLVQAGTARAKVLDDLRDARPWQASASDQVSARLERDARDRSLCLHYDFNGVSGYAVMRRELPLQWPADFVLGLRLKGEGGVNDVQVKLVDASGDNVWRVNRTHQVLPSKPSDWRFKRRHLQFAWGPTEQRRLQSTQAIELVVAAGRDGGRGRLCLASLSLQPREPDPAVWPEPRGHLQQGRWTLDFQRLREFNGLALRWPEGWSPGDYQVRASDDGRRWNLLRQVRGSDGGLDTLWLPEHEARWLRLEPLKPVAQPLQVDGLPRLELRSAAQWPDLNAVLTEQGRDLPRGQLPRSLRGEQNHWTVVGVDGGGGRSALLDEDGGLELGRGGPSITPVLQTEDGRFITWADVQIAHSLRDNHLPLPRVRWSTPALALDIEAVADGPAATPRLLARYTLHNRSDRPQRLALWLLARPWQVNPPQQFLTTPGGASPVSRIHFDHRQSGALQLDRRPPLRLLSAPDAVRAAGFDGGLGLQALDRAAPLIGLLGDPQGLASAALQWRITLAPGQSQQIGFSAGLGSGPAPDVAAPPDAAALEAAFEQAAAAWRARLNRVAFSVPPAQQRLVDTLRSSLAHMLISRDGPALRPGTRSYARSWIRDGAMMVAGLLALGEDAVAREFVDWFAGHVYASGKVPCCVDARGADPVVENDSHGQYLYAVAELMRHGAQARDPGWLARHWPTVQRVVAWQEGLRQSERTAANQAPARRHLYGLMPPSISHEGYSDKPAYSYWDDFWALRGYKDAVQIAQALGQADEARRWAGWRDEFQRELADSIAATARLHGIGWVAGAADRGDFDATSTTMALSPAQAELPPAVQALLDATFERYWQETRARADGSKPWRDYTPYELRSIGSLVRLGRPERAHALLDFFFGHQRPAGWNQWAEVVLPDAREPRFLGDMPHAWVSSDYVRSVIDLFGWQRERDGAVLIGAGLDTAQLDALGPGQAWGVAGLPMAGGLLHWRLERAHDGAGWRLQLAQGLPAPRRLVWPGSGPLPRVVQVGGGAPEHAGRMLAWQPGGRELPLPDGPLDLRLLPAP